MNLVINKTHCLRPDHHLEKLQSRCKKKVRNKEKQILQSYSDRSRPDTDKGRNGKEKTKKECF